MEGVIAVGNEFGSVEALWSQFENVMGHDATGMGDEGRSEGGEGEEKQEEAQEERSEGERSP